MTDRIEQIRARHEALGSKESWQDGTFQIWTEVRHLLAEVDQLRAQRDAAAKVHVSDGPTEGVIEGYQSAVNRWRDMQPDTAAVIAGAMLHDLNWLRRLRANTLQNLAELAAENIRLRARLEGAQAAIRTLDTYVAAVSAGPTIIVLCGSTRFMDDINEVNRWETAAGRIVLAPSCNLKHPHPLWAEPDELERLKTQLDELHRAKIRLADEVVVVAPGGYIGDSTRAEIAYARELGKPVRYWPEQDPRPDDGGPATTPVEATA